MAELHRQNLILFSSLIILLYLAYGGAADCKGCVELDTFSFDKVINNYSNAVSLLPELIRDEMHLTLSA